MNAAYPAAWSALAFLNLCDCTLDVIFSRGGLFYRDVPADKFVTSERREAFPGVYSCGRSEQGFFEVCRKFVDGATRESFGSHVFMVHDLGFSHQR